MSVLPDGMAQRSDGAIWNPRPHPDATNFDRRAYMAGYSDGFHGYPFGSGDEGAYGAFSSYRPGFADGRADAADVPPISPSIESEIERLGGGA